MTKKNILFISMLPPIQSSRGAGEKTFHFYFEKFVNDENFDTRLITCALYSDHVDVEKELVGIEKKIIYWNYPDENKLAKLINIESKLNPFNRNANLTSNLTELRIIEALDEYIKDNFKPEIIILEWTEMVVLARTIKKKYPEILLIASEHDVTFIGYERKSDYYKGLKGLFWKIKYILEKRTELKALKACDLVLPHNANNKEILIQNGIKADKIFGLVPYYNNMSDLSRSNIDNTILFYGAMNRMENSISAKWFIKEVMPLLQDIDCQFVILGSNPDKELKSLQSEKIVITGFVEDIRPFFNRAKCFVAPLQLGAGIKIKVLEALSSGIPVITNEIGIEGIPVQREIDFYLCKTANQYSEVIHSIFSDYSKCKSIGENGKMKMLDHFSPETFWEQYKMLVLSL